MQKLLSLFLFVLFLFSCQTPPPAGSEHSSNRAEVTFTQQDTIGLYSFQPQLLPVIHNAVLTIEPISTSGFPVMPRPTDVEMDRLLSGLIVITPGWESMGLPVDIRNEIRNSNDNQFRLIVFQDVPFLLIKLNDDVDPVDFFTDELSSENSILIQSFIRSIKTGENLINAANSSGNDDDIAEGSDPIVESSNRNAANVVDNDKADTTLRENSDRFVGSEITFGSVWPLSVDSIEFLPDIWNNRESLEGSRPRNSTSLFIPFKRFSQPFSFDPKTETVLDLQDHPMFGALEPFDVEMVILEPLNVWLERTKDIYFRNTDLALSDSYLILIDNELVEKLVLIPETLLDQRESLAQELMNGTKMNRSQSQDFASFLSSGLIKRNHILLMPFEPIRLGGRDTMLIPSAISFDFSSIMSESQRGFELDISGSDGFAASIEVETIDRTQRPSFSLYDIPPDLVAISVSGHSLGFDWVNQWGESFPRSGSGAIFNYLPFPSKGRVPLVVFFSPNYSYREEEAVNAMFGLSQSDLARELERTPLFYRFYDYREDLPQLLLIGARDPETLFWHLENDPNFRAAVERFYNQEYGPLSDTIY